MPYNSSLDKQLFVRELEVGEGKIVVSVYSYNNGANKLQIGREIKNKEGLYNFARLGRLSKQEAEGILPLIQEALSAM
ncbi:MAG: hypothetical protein QMD94_02605 [Candidatus Omnitrophota bacterium]|nr:hypothetical protein [Candidatus Omnitrophota bacterium]